jgi:hypothetical protein
MPGMEGVGRQLYEAPGVASLVVACLNPFSVASDAVHAFETLAGWASFRVFWGVSKRALL